MALSGCAMRLWFDLAVKILKQICEICFYQTWN
uniref:Uncharacterized protein n=1 Tax=Anguilla anguilla TaxID=7936 RepID=A0A0E9XXN1_ANGAN